MSLHTIHGLRRRRIHAGHEVVSHRVTRHRIKLRPGARDRKTSVRVELRFCRRHRLTLHRLRITVHRLLSMSVSVIHGLHRLHGLRMAIHRLQRNGLRRLPELRLRHLLRLIRRSKLLTRCNLVRLVSVVLLHGLALDT